MLKRIFDLKICLLVVVLILHMSCGIDNYIYLEPPSQVLHTATVYDDDSQKYILFRTSDSINESEEQNNFYGFEIFYKIYNSSSVRDQDISAIATYNTNNPTTVQKWLVDSKKYHRLASSSRGDSVPLIEKTSSDREVYVRLTAYGAVQPCILAGEIAELSESSILVSGDDYGLPLRTKDGATNIGDMSYRFDFTEIGKDDTDVQFSANESELAWYVQFYVCTYGYDSSYQSIYSSVCSLGSITIRE
jgi:hypothetical protein